MCMRRTDSCLTSRRISQWRDGLYKAPAALSLSLSLASFCSPSRHCMSAYAYCRCAPSFERICPVQKAFLVLPFPVFVHLFVLSSAMQSALHITGFQEDQARSASFSGQPLQRDGESPPQRQSLLLRCHSKIKSLCSSADAAVVAECRNWPKWRAVRACAAGLRAGLTGHTSVAPTFGREKL